MSKLIKSCLVFAVGMMFNAHVFANVDGELIYPNNHGSTLYEHVSPGARINIVDAYISYKYVGGFHLVVTFSVPDDAYDKEVYLVMDPKRGRTVKGEFAESITALNYGQGNITWLKTENGRAYFVMVANTFNGFTYRNGGDYELYVKLAGKEYMSRFWLR